MKPETLAARQAATARRLGIDPEEVCTLCGRDEVYDEWDGTALCIACAENILADEEEGL